MNGIWYSQPYDLNAMGSDGATVSAAHGGMRYIWMLGCDHPEWSGPTGSGDFYVGFSNDPQIWPDPSTVTMLRRQDNSINLTDTNGYVQNTFLVYHFPRLVYNPDSAGDKFWIYAEGLSVSSSRQHELSLFTTTDFVSTTLVGPVIPTTAFGGWTSLGYVYRVATGNWWAVTFGKIDGSATSTVYYKYTSSDGLSWTPDYSTIIAGPGPYTTIGGQSYMLTKQSGSVNTYVSLLAIDNTTHASLGTYTNISTAFGPDTGNGSAYPGPTYLQSAWGYEEDGVMSIYASRGFFSSGSSYVLNDGPYLNNSPTFFNIIGTIASNVLTVTAIDPGGVLAVGQRLQHIASFPTITSFGTGSGGLGTYNVSATSDIGSPTSILISTNGGLWHEFIDQYYYITNSSTAVGAAPLGVKADCVNGTVTVSWNNCLPNNTYRVYKGSTSGTQTTLVGDVTGTAITDAPTLGQQWWYKVVTLNSGVEQKSRVVHCYASNNTLMVTRHINRVINDGGDPTKINVAFLASVDSYLTSNDYYKYLIHWADVRFGVRFDGSSFINKVYCLGTTRLPRGGDYTPTTSNTFPSTSSNTSYSATSFRGTTPSWVNNANNACGYFGNGRMNTIQRKNQITLIAAYQKPGTLVATLFGYGYNSGMYLTHASGSSGNVTFGLANTINPPGTFITATVAFASATNAHVAAAVHDGSTMTAYLDGVAGTPLSSSAYNNPNMLNDSVLRGLMVGATTYGGCLGSGSHEIVQTTLSRTYTFYENEALFTCAALIAFEKGLSSSDISTIGAMYS